MHGPSAFSHSHPPHPLLGGSHRHSRAGSPPRALDDPKRVAQRHGGGGRGGSRGGRGRGKANHPTDVLARSMFSGPGLVVAVAGQRAQFVIAMMDDTGTGPTRPHGVLIQVRESLTRRERGSHALLGHHTLYRAVGHRNAGFRMVPRLCPPGMLHAGRMKEVCASSCLGSTCTSYLFVRTHLLNLPHVCFSFRCKAERDEALALP